MWQMWLLFFILGYFLLFYTSNSPKNKTFKKMKKTSGDIILSNCTKNYDYSLYCSWDMARDGFNCYFSFWHIFCPFTSLTARKNENFKKMKKKPGDITILHKCTKNHDHMTHNTCNFCFSFWAIFCPFTP